VTTAGALVAKLCGFDVELGNFISGWPEATDTATLASRLVLARVRGIPARHEVANAYAGSYAAVYGRGFGATAAGGDPQEQERKFLPCNGGSIYIDLSHVELAGPEVLSAFDFVAAYHAMLRLAREAMQRANESLPAGRKIHLLANNSDGFCSYGHHVNVLVSRRAFTNIFERKAHHLLFLASCQVSALPLTGAGKVGADNGAPAVDYQISQRADWFETLVAPQTTFRRPVVNSRDENLAGGGYGPGAGLARVHSIFFDAGLCQVATLLKAGILQIVLAMIEAEHVPAALLLEDPVEAARVWSHDPSLRRRARLLDGSELTAVELQMRILDAAHAFAAAGQLEACVPRAAEILALWADTVERLAARDFSALAPRLDWILKLRLLEQLRERQPGISWSSPRLRHLDQLYASLAEDEGLYWACERSGAVQTVVDPQRIAYLERNPPADTRAWTRAMLLRLAHRQVESVDWDSLEIRLRPISANLPRTVQVDLADPLALTRVELEERCLSATSLEEILERLAER